MRLPSLILAALLMAAAPPARVAIAASRLPTGRTPGSAADSADSARTGNTGDPGRGGSTTGLTLMAVGFAVLGVIVVATQRKTAASE